MSVWLAVGIAILLLLILLLFLPVGAEIRFGDTTVAVLRFGFIRKKLKTDGERESKPKKKKKAKKTKKPKKAKKTKLKFGVDDAERALTELLPAVRRAMTHLRRSLVFSPLDLHIVIGGEEPYETARRYGYASAALYILLPALEDACTVRRPHVLLESDFDSGASVCRGELGISANVGSLLAFAGMLLTPVLRFYRAIPRVPVAEDVRKSTEKEGVKDGK